VQAHDCVEAQALAEHLRQVHKEYQRRKASVFVQQVVRAQLEAASRHPPSDEERLQVCPTQAQAPLMPRPSHNYRWNKQRSCW